MDPSNAEMFYHLGLCSNRYYVYQTNCEKYKMLKIKTWQIYHLKYCKKIEQNCFLQQFFQKWQTNLLFNSNTGAINAKISVIYQRIFKKFKMQISWTVKVQLVIIKLPQFKKCNFNTCFLYRKLCAIIIRLLNIKK
jgi:hypothetical protein